MLLSWLEPPLLPVSPGGPQCTWFLSPKPQPGLHSAGVVVVVDAVVDVVVDEVVVVVGCVVVVAGAVVVVVDAVVVVVGAVVVVVDAVVDVVDDDELVVDAVVDDVLDEVLDDELVEDVLCGAGENSAPSVSDTAPGAVGSARAPLMRPSCPLQPAAPVGIAGMMNVLSTNVEPPVAALYATPPACDVSRVSASGPRSHAVIAKSGIARGGGSVPLKVTWPVAGS